MMIKTAAQVGTNLDATTINIKVVHAKIAGIDSKNLIVGTSFMLFILGYTNVSPLETLTHCNCGEIYCPVILNEELPG